MDQDVHMLLEGTLAELILKREPILFRKYIWKKQQANVVCKLKKAIYGTLQALLLF